MLGDSLTDRGLWYENGLKSQEVTFTNGEEDGLYTWWDQQGQKMYEETYKKGK